MLAPLRKLAASLAPPAALGAQAVAARHLGAAPQKPESEDEDFQLLPPGCSLKDPTYGRTFGAGGRNSLSDPVEIYDQKPVEEYRPLKKRQSVPSPPMSRAAAEAQLQSNAEAKKRASGAAAGGAAAAEEDVYVYLPPGSSMRDPLPSSLSDPLENRPVYYRDPNPSTPKK